MAYVKSEKTLAEIEGRKGTIVAAAIDALKSDGHDAVTSAEVSERSGLSVGLIYKHFPDIEELRAHVFAILLARDIEVLQAHDALPDALRAWAKHMAKEPRLSQACSNSDVYREGIRRELVRMIKVSAPECGWPTISAGVVAGAVFEVAATLRPRDELALTAALLRAIGVRSKASA